jgi:hypothetical protein
VALEYAGRMAEISVFLRMTAGRNGDEPMLRKTDGTPWKKGEQVRPIAAAIKAAKISPTISFHGLHSFASQFVSSGASLPQDFLQICT